MRYNSLTVNCRKFIWRQSKVNGFHLNYFKNEIAVKYANYLIFHLREGYGFDARPWYRGYSTWCSMLGPNRIIAKDVKNCTYCYYVRCATLMIRVGGSALAPNRPNSSPCTVRTLRQRSCNYREGFLLWSMARINDPWDGS